MGIHLKCGLKEGQKVRFRDHNLSVEAQHVPQGLKGIVRASYLTANGIALTEKTDVVFSIKDPNGGQPEDVEVRGIAASNLEKTL